MSLKFKFFLFLVVVFVGMQFKTIDRTNPPVEAELSASPEVMELLRRACYDCHSNESEWPWYSYVAPVSWLIEHDVEEAREHMNFSEWQTWEPGKQDHKREECWEEVEEGEMPLWFYTPLHWDARLSEGDLAVVIGTGGVEGGEACGCAMASVDWGGSDGASGSASPPIAASISAPRASPSPCAGATSPGGAEDGSWTAAIPSTVAL